MTMPSQEPEFEADDQHPRLRLTEVDQSCIACHCDQNAQQESCSGCHHNGIYTSSHSPKDNGDIQL